ncbi:MAG: hypothetical protein COA79_02415 [Planctomycetota bacterium]|nr:MAG: hypothetical protein COA79_02415 [Planctomycetota bacterium]
MKFNRSTYLLFILVINLSSLISQEESHLTKTMNTIETSQWLKIIDRGDTVNKRPGIIRSYDDRMDHQYAMDFYSYNYSILEDSNYHLNDNAVRGWIGSINSSVFYTNFDFKVPYEVNEDVLFNLNFFREENYSAEHNLFIPRLTRRNIFDQKLSIHIEFTAEFIKESLDVMIGAQYKPIPSLSFSVDIAMLDFLNNSLHSGGIKTHQQEHSRQYDTSPLGFKFQGLWKWNNYKIEAFGGSTLSEKAEIEFEESRGRDFITEMYYSYWGVLIEKAWSDDLTTGLFVNDQYADDIKTGSDGFDITEHTLQVGAYVLKRFNERWLLEVEAVYSKLEYEKDLPTTGGNLDTDDFDVVAKAEAFWNYKEHIQLSSGLFFNRHVMEELLEDVLLTDTIVRYKFGVQYHFNDKMFIKITSNIGLDDFYSYGGSAGHISILW